MDSEINKNYSLISQARGREDFKTARELRALNESLERRKSELIAEAAIPSRRIWDKVKSYK